MASIELEGVSKRYGDVSVLEAIDLSIRNREFVVLLGPSGGGKTALLRLIAGLDRVSSGEIRIAGKPVTEAPAGMRNLAMVFQYHGLYPHMTVAQNIAFPLQMKGLPKSVQSEMVTLTAERVGVASELERLPATLSGGQQQRVALARAVVRQPSVVLMDEPLSSLDTQRRIALRTEIRALIREARATAIYVTHDPVEAMTLADRIIVLANGRVQQIGPPEEVYDIPANVTVARVLGNPPMNILKGEIASGVFRGENVQIEGLAQPDGPVLLGFRVEDCQVIVERMGFTGCEVAAPLSELEKLGDAVQVRVPAGGGNVVARVAKGFRMPLGSHVRILVPPDICHVFHTETGTRLDGQTLLLT